MINLDDGPNLVDVLKKKIASGGTTVSSSATGNKVSGASRSKFGSEVGKDEAAKSSPQKKAVVANTTKLKVVASKPKTKLPEKSLVLAKDKGISTDNPKKISAEDAARPTLLLLPKS